MSEEGAAALLLGLHGQALRAACNALDTHHQGLAVASRQLYRKGLITARMKKQLSDLDIVSGWIRHVSRPRVDSMLEELRQQLQASPALFDGIDGSSSSGSSDSEMRSLLSYNTAIACEKGVPMQHMEVLYCPKMVSLPNMTENDAATSCNDAFLVQSEKGAHDSAEISYNAAISEQCEKDMQGNADISYNAAISSDMFATPENKIGNEERYVTPTTGCIGLSTLSNAKDGDEVEFEDEMIIQQFLNSDVREMPEFPKLEDEISYSAAISEKSPLCAASEVISSSAAISEKGQFGATSALLSSCAASCEKGVVDTVISSSAAQLPAHGTTSRPTAELELAINESEKGVIDTVISSSAAICEKGVCAYGGAEISYNVAIIGSEKGPGIATEISYSAAISASSELVMPGSAATSVLGPRSLDMTSFNAASSAEHFEIGSEADGENFQEELLRADHLVSKMKVAAGIGEVTDQLRESEEAVKWASSLTVSNNVVQTPSQSDDLDSVCSIPELPPLMLCECAHLVVEGLDLVMTGELRDEQVVLRASQELLDAKCIAWFSLLARFKIEWAAAIIDVQEMCGKDILAATLVGVITKDPVQKFRGDAWIQCKEIEAWETWFS